MTEQSSIELEAINLVKLEKERWEVATAFVTRKVAFQMRNLIDQLRKNYWGIFDEPTDPTTRRKKIWIPLTESIVESVVKNIDLDTKDISFKAKRQEAIGLTGLVRNIVKNELDYIGFGEALDELERMLAIDGTAVWKTISYYDEKRKKKCIKIIPVDLLNFYIDSTAHSIQEAESVIERALLTVAEVKSMNGWINAKDVQGSTGLDRRDGQFSQTFQNTGNTPLVEVFERWGLMPKKLLTGDPEDTDLVEGHIVVSGTRGDWRIHLVEANTKKLKPYEEAWYTRVPGRWYGKGVAEKVMMLQLYVNTIVNIRINRSYLAQQGIYKIRQGSGITPQSISKLAANGAITVQTMDDIQQLVMQEASAASYKDEEAGMSWARQVTGAYEAITGESLPSSTTATIGAIQNRNASSQFVLIKEGIGMFLERWVKNHAMSVILGDLKRETVVRYYPQSLADYDEARVNQELYAQLESIHASRGFLDPAQVELERQRAIAQLQATGDHRFVRVLDAVEVMDYDVDVQITNEDFDKGILMQNLISALQAAPEYKKPILDELFDTMGIGPFTAPVAPPVTTPPPTIGQQNPTEVMTQANTGEAYGKAQALTKVNG
jgi:hypothetical protein